MPNGIFNLIQQCFRRHTNTLTTQMLIVWGGFVIEKKLFWFRLVCFECLYDSEKWIFLSYSPTQNSHSDCKQQQKRIISLCIVSVSCQLMQHKMHLKTFCLLLIMCEYGMWTNKGTFLLLFPFPFLLLLFFYSLLNLQFVTLYTLMFI